MTSSVKMDDCYEEIAVIINKYQLDHYELFGVLGSLKENLLIETIKKELGVQE